MHLHTSTGQTTSERGRQPRCVHKSQQRHQPRASEGVSRAVCMREQYARTHGYPCTCMQEKYTPAGDTLACVCAHESSMHTRLTPMCNKQAEHARTCGPYAYAHEDDMHVLTAHMHVHVGTACTWPQHMHVCTREQCISTPGARACAYESSVHTPTAPMHVHTRAACTRPQHLCMCIREQRAHAHSTYACESRARIRTAPTCASEGEAQP